MPAPTSIAHPSGPSHAQPLVGVVAIGRNEGERLRRCLESIRKQGLEVVYVDSGSSDDSVSLARSLGAEVHELDLTQPFTAARARNAGWRALREIAPETELVQFLDGDCELVGTWIERATRELIQNPRLAAVCGRRRERFPEASVYNRLCDLEWDTPVGDALECGGDVLMRFEALEAVEGYNPTLIAGEEPELCVRLRDAGWGIRRIDAEMTLHDAAMTRFGQWWQRSKRCGHTYAHAFSRYGLQREPRYARSVASVVLWALIFPTTMAAQIATSLALGAKYWALVGVALLALGYARIVVGVARNHKPDSNRRRDAWLYGLACTIGKFPELGGMLLFMRNRMRGREARIIEYKPAPVRSAPSKGALITESQRRAG